MNDNPQIEPIHFGIYGDGVIEKMKTALCNVRISWRVRSSNLIRLPDGEAVYMPDYAMSDDTSRQTKKRLSTGLVKAAKCLYYDTFKSTGEDLSTLAKLRASVHNNDELNNSGGSTINELLLIAELLQGDKTKANIIKTYPDETVKKIIAEPAQPFVAAAVSTLEDKKKMLLAERDAEFKVVIDAYNAKTDELRKKWDAIIAAIDNQINEVRVVSFKN